MTGTSPVPVADARRHFPGAAGCIFLDAAAHALLPAGAVTGVSLCLGDAITRGGSAATMSDTRERVRAKFARLIGAEPEDIALTKNVSEGINAIVHSLPWRPGDNAVLCPAIEHPNSIYAIHAAHLRHGVEVRNLSPTPDRATPVAAIAGAIDERTRLVVASTVSFAFGTRTDLDGLADLCRRRGVVLLVDGAQSVGALDLDVTRTPIGALAVGGSKFLCAPSGTGFLFVRRELAKATRPAAPGLYSHLPEDAYDPAKGVTEHRLKPCALRFEVGSYNYLGINAVEASLDIFGAVTVPAIERHVLGLARRFSLGIADLALPMVSSLDEPLFSQLVVIGNGDPNSALAAMLRDLHGRLDAAGVKTSLRGGGLRFAFHLYNTRDEADAVLAIIRNETRTWARS